MSRDLLASGLINPPKRKQYEREALIDSFYYAENVGLTTLDIEVLESAHYYLMQNPYFWNRKELREADQIIVSRLSEIRTDRMYFLAPKALLTWKTIEVCEHFDDKIICRLEHVERRVCKVCDCDRWDLV